MHPTKKQLNECSKSKDGIIATIFNRKLSIIITKYSAILGITPTQMNFLSFLCVLISAYLVIRVNHSLFIVAAIMAQLSLTLDCCDGELARLYNKASNWGGFVDASLDRISELIIFLALSYAFYIQTGNHYAWLYGMLSLASIYLTYLMIDLTVKNFGKEKLRKEHLESFLGKISRATGIQPHHLAIGIDFHWFIISLGLLLNKIWWIFLFFIIIQNLYWIVIMLKVYTSKK